MRPSNNLENKTLSGTYWRIQLVHMTQSFLESPLEDIQDQMPLINQSSLWPFEPSWEIEKYYAVSD